MPPKGLSVSLNLNKVANDIVKNYEQRQSRIKDMAAKSAAKDEPIEKANVKKQIVVAETPKLYSYVVARY